MDLMEKVAEMRCSFAANNSVINLINLSSGKKEEMMK